MPIDNPLTQGLAFHTHDGINSPKIDFTKSTTTAANNGALTSADATIIANMRTRIAELETCLRNNGLLT